MKTYVILAIAMGIASMSSAMPKKEYVSTLIVALDSLASVSIPIGGDTETQWAADTVHSMAGEALRDNENPNKQLARAHVMQSYIAYGINCFVGILCSYHKPEMAGWALQGALPETEQLYAALDSTNYANEKRMFDLSMSSLINLAMYLRMDEVVHSTNDYPSAYYPTWAEGICDSLYNTMSDKHEAMKLCRQMESTAFFMAYSCLINRFTSSKQEHDANMETIIPIATYFDSHTQPIHTALFEGASFPTMSETEYKEFLDKSLEYRIAMIRLLTKQWILVGSKKK